MQVNKGKQKKFFSPQGPGPFAKRKDQGGGAIIAYLSSQLLEMADFLRDEIFCKNMNIF